MSTTREIELNFSQMLETLCSSKKLDRDRAIPEVEKFVREASDVAIEQLGDALLALAHNSDPAWENRNCAMLGAKCVLSQLHSGHKYFDHFASEMKTHALRLLTDDEVRVRLAAGEVLGVLCQKCGVAVFVECKDFVLDLIRVNLERQPSISENTSMEEINNGRSLSPSPERRADAIQIFHDTAGWKCLETSMTALQRMVEGCGNDFEEFINDEMLQLIFKAIAHPNRFVRETGFYVITSFISCGVSTLEEASMSSEFHFLREDSGVMAFGPQLAYQLGLGLNDNWSQVRLAAAVAVRKFLLSLEKEAREQFFPELLPKLCLNRYYLAEGVRLYSQETWRLIVGTEGRELVRKYIDAVVEHYISQTKVNNHAVREAACSCIAELATKINKDAVKPYVPELLNTLIICFQDDSWPVRDSACLACGNFISAFPEESKESLDTLYPLFYANLEDTIPSVRQGAAAALAILVKTYGEETLVVVLTKIKDGLIKVENQPEESEKYVGLEQGPAMFGVVKRLRDNDMDLHTNKTMYSCGSLAPRMGRGCSGGCMSGLQRTFRQPPQPWELADGCIYAVSEMASLSVMITHLPSLLELIAKAANVRHYTHHYSLLETLCKQLPIIAKGIGKREFKPYLELFLEPIFYSLNSSNQLTSSAASDCLNQLSAFLGPNIFRSRIEQFNPSYLRDFEAHQTFP